MTPAEFAFIKQDLVDRASKVLTEQRLSKRRTSVPSGQELSSTKAINNKTGEIIDTEPNKILAPGFTAIPGGVKHDESKRRMDLVPTSLVSSVARVLEFGARKYGDNNWRKGLKWSRIYAALQRHLADFWEGNDLDSESGLPHLYHAACNIAFLIEFYEKRKELDDRYRGDEVPGVGKAVLTNNPREISPF